MRSCENGRVDASSQARIQQDAVLGSAVLAFLESMDVPVATEAAFCEATYVAKVQAGVLDGNPRWLNRPVVELTPTGAGKKGCDKAYGMAWTVYDYLERVIRQQKGSALKDLRLIDVSLNIGIIGGEAKLMGMEDLRIQCGVTFTDHGVKLFDDEPRLAAALYNKAAA